MSLTEEGVLGKDLKLLGSHTGADLEVRNGDLLLAEGRDNLVQALSLRLRSYKGVLRLLGHPAYGSRVIEAIGTVKNPANLRRVERLVREAIMEEPRVKLISSLNIRNDATLPGKIDVEVSVIPISGQMPLNLVVSVEEGSLL